MGSCQGLAKLKLQKQNAGSNAKTEDGKAKSIDIIDVFTLKFIKITKEHKYRNDTDQIFPGIGNNTTQSTV